MRTRLVIAVLVASCRLLMGQIVPLTGYEGAELGPSFSPDGTRVAFSWNGEHQDNWDVYVKGISDSKPVRLTTDPGDDVCPAWAPDGRRIAFLRAKGVYVISAQGGPEKKIADFEATLTTPSWTPDGKSLIVTQQYRINSGSGPGKIYVLSVESGALRPLLAPDAGQWYHSASLSPDGHTLAFALCSETPLSPKCMAAVVPVSPALRVEGTRRVLTTESAALGNIAWMNDSRALVYGAGGRLWRVEANGRQKPELLTVAGDKAFTPAIAPRGGQLAFSQREKPDADIWRLDLGGEPHPFLTSPAMDGAAEFSPDGRQVVFASARVSNRMALWLAKTDGTSVRQLTTGPEYYHGAPSWAPDGRLIAFDARGADGKWNIKVTGCDGTGQRQLTDGPAENTAPRWSHGGKWIYFASDRSGRFEVWRVSPDGSGTEQMTREGGYLASDSLDGNTLYYTKQAAGGDLYCRARTGGPETKLPIYVYGRGLVVFRDGIYYLDDDHGSNYKIKFYDFATRKTRLVSAIEFGPIKRNLWLGFSVAPEASSFLFTVLKPWQADLMLINNFH